MSKFKICITLFCIVSVLFLIVNLNGTEGKKYLYYNDANVRVNNFRPTVSEGNKFVIKIVNYFTPNEGSHATPSTTNLLLVADEKIELGSQLDILDIYYIDYFNEKYLSIDPYKTSDISATPISISEEKITFKIAGDLNLRYWLAGDWPDDKVDKKLDYRTGYLGKDKVWWTNRTKVIEIDCEIKLKKGKIRNQKRQ